MGVCHGATLDIDDERGTCTVKDKVELVWS